MKRTDARPGVARSSDPRRLGAFLGALAAVLLPAFGAPPSLTAQTRNIRFDRIQVEQGLPQVSVTAILQDRVGFMWFGTQNGLARYDGSRFQVYDHDPTDPATLPNDYIPAVLEDLSGDLWVGTLGGGLSRWHRRSDTFAHYQHSPSDGHSLSGNRVQALHQDADGALWVGTAQSGLNRLVRSAADPAAVEFERFSHDPEDASSLSDDRIRAIYEDRLRVLWVATLDGLNLYDRDTGLFIHLKHDPEKPLSLSHDGVRSILEDHTGTLWVGTLGGLNRLDRATLAFERFVHDPSDPSSLSDNAVRVLFEDRDGRLWVGTDGGLNLFHRPSGTFRRYRNYPADIYSLSDNRVTSIYQDRGGVLWVGTHSAGVNKWNPITWDFSHHRSDPSDTESLKNNHVLALSEDPAGGLWVGTDGGLHRVDRADHSVRQYQWDPKNSASLSSNKVSALLHDRRGTLWVGTLSSGLNWLDVGSEAFGHTTHDPDRDDSLGSDGVMSLYEDRRGTLWVGTFGGGLNRLDDAATMRFSGFRHDPSDSRSLSNDRVTAFAEDTDGSLWVGTFGGGLNLLDAAQRETQREGSFLRLQHDSALPAGLSNDTIYALHVDAAGNLWAGTQVGLNRLSGLDRATGQAVFRRYFERDGLSNDTVYGIYSDAAGNLWLSTIGGLSRFDRDSETFKNYTASHGLQSNEFNMGAHFQSPSGELFFGGVNGFNAFHPDRIEHNSAVPPVVLTAFSKLNQPVELERPVFALQELELDSRDSVFSFEFAALDYTAPAENRYRYMLEGWDDGWIDLGNHSRVTFSNFEPGNYVLRVQGSNNDGVWNEDGIALKITLRPPFWKTLWFRLGGFLLLASLIAYTLRTRMIRVTNERLQILVAERTRALEEAQKQLFRRKKLAVLGELAGGVAHELRNPLGTIKNAIYYLQLTGEVANGKLKEHLELIEHEVDRSNRIITELLDWGRSPEPELARVAFQEIVDEALAEVGVTEGILVERQFETRPVIVEVGRGQIRRILTNLLRNATEAMPEGGRLRVECRRQGDEAIAAIVDTGIGISEENISKVFEPLFSGKSKGIGLGLPISQRYANLNHGRIECESKLGEGASFRLVLPAKENDERLPLSGAEEKSAAAEDKPAAAPSAG